MENCYHYIVGDVTNHCISTDFYAPSALCGLKKIVKHRAEDNADVQPNNIYKVTIYYKGLYYKSFVFSSDENSDVCYE